MGEWASRVAWHMWDVSVVMSFGYVHMYEHDSLALLYNVFLLNFLFN